MLIPKKQEQDNSSKRKWFKAERLKKIASVQSQKKEEAKKYVKDNMKEVVLSYACQSCKKSFGSSLLRKQFIEAVRNGQDFISCPVCSSVLIKDRIIKVATNIGKINRNADLYSYPNQNIVPGYTPQTWVDRAILEKVAHELSKFAVSVGMFNPQLKFQRGIRGKVREGAPENVKFAEYTIESVDDKDLRFRVVAVAGITPAGEVVLPKVFSTLDGREIPFTKEAIQEFVSGKVFGGPEPIPAAPKVYHRERDFTRFREIVAKKKTAAGIPTPGQKVEYQGKMYTIDTTMGDASVLRDETGMQTAPIPHTDMNVQVEPGTPNALAAPTIESMVAPTASVSDKIEKLVKKSLRDEKTLVPFTDSDPDYSVAKQTDVDADFGTPYEKSDQGILPEEDRAVQKMFRGGTSIIPTNKKVAEEEKEMPEEEEYATITFPDLKVDREKFEALIKEKSKDLEKVPSIKASLEKKAEPTGYHETDERGKQISIDRLRQLVEDYVRAGQIPLDFDLTKITSEVSRMTRKELEEIIDKKLKNQHYPVVHAKKDGLKKIARLQLFPVKEDALRNAKELGQLCESERHFIVVPIILNENDIDTFGASVFEGETIPGEEYFVVAENLEEVKSWGLKSKILASKKTASTWTDLTNQLVDILSGTQGTLEDIENAAMASASELNAFLTVNNLATLKEWVQEELIEEEGFIAEGITMDDILQIFKKYIDPKKMRVASKKTADKNIFEGTIVKTLGGLSGVVMEIIPGYKFRTGIVGTGYKVSLDDERQIVYTLADLEKAGPKIALKGKSTNEIVLEMRKKADFSEKMVKEHIKEEEEGAEMYNDMAKEVECPKAEKALNDMADDETEHAEKLEEVVLPAVEEPEEETEKEASKKIADTTPEALKQYIKGMYNLEVLDGVAKAITKELNNLPPMSAGEAQKLVGDRLREWGYGIKTASLRFAQEEVDVKEKPKTEFKELKTKPHGKPLPEEVKIAPAATPEMQKVFNDVQAHKQRLTEIQSIVDDARRKVEEQIRAIQEEHRSVTEASQLQEGIEKLASLVESAQTQVVDFGELLAYLDTSIKEKKFKPSDRWRVEKLLSRFGKEAEDYLRKAEEGSASLNEDIQQRILTVFPKRSESSIKEANVFDSIKELGKGLMEYIKSLSEIVEQGEQLEFVL